MHDSSPYGPARLSLPSYFTRFGIELVICDVDLTLVMSAEAPGESRLWPDDWQWMPGRRDVLLFLRKAGIHVALATNQGKVATGEWGKHEITHEIHRVGEEIGSGVHVEIAYAHPSALSLREEIHLRKPGPGMLINAMRHFGVSSQRAIMVGDRAHVDGLAALGAGVMYLDHAEFFRGFERPGVEFV